MEFKVFSRWDLRSLGVAFEKAATSVLSQSLKMFNTMCIKYVHFSLTFKELTTFGLTITLREVGTGQQWD